MAKRDKKGRYIKGNKSVSFWKGKKMTKEHKDKMSKAKKGDKCYLYKDGRSLNKEYRSWIKNRHYYRKKAASGSHTFGEWENLKAQFNWTCPMCEKTNIKLTEDHIIPLSKGGSDNIENIQPLCLKCNMAKHTNIINYKETIKWQK